MVTPRRIARRHLFEGGADLLHARARSLARGSRAWPVAPLADPIVALGASPEAARMVLAQYLFQMYGLLGLGDGRSVEVLEQVLALAESCFGPIMIECVERVPELGDSFRARLPRVAAFAVGAAPGR